MLVEPSEVSVFVRTYREVEEEDVVLVEVEGSLLKKMYVFRKIIFSCGLNSALVLVLHNLAFCDMKPLLRFDAAAVVGEFLLLVFIIFNVCCEHRDFFHDLKACVRDGCRCLWQTFIANLILRITFR